jgi:molybdopterin-containing oxidoreductase family membrane subunit
VEKLSFKEIDDAVLGAMKSPRLLYYPFLLLLAGGVGMFFVAWIHQVKVGMGMAGISSPVGWGVYIGNFVFWVGIAHSGTLISAILHLVRSKWRSAVSRAAEAMTIFAVMTAGLFPLVHLGRLWVFWFILPYPSQRDLWPNFTSPLVWDVVAVTTYLTVSSIFWYVGMIPDLASARDRWTKEYGPDHPRTRFYRKLAIGWTGAGSQWMHYGRSYLFFAALATPLVISVHSVVSWDFAMGILPGWHTTIFPPYFVAGAIHSGLAMVLTLMIPMRKLLKLERIITIKHLEAIALTIIVTTCVVGYAYIVEPWMSWYSGDKFEWQFTQWRWTGWMWHTTWALGVCNVLVPLLFVFKRFRTRLWSLFAISIVINIGMWLERYWIVVGSTSHDFMPHNWGEYAPKWTEYCITIGAFMFFLFWFYIFAKVLPTIAIAEVKEVESEKEKKSSSADYEDYADEEKQKPNLRESAKSTDVFAERPGAARSGVVGVFSSEDGLSAAMGKLPGEFSRIETFTPVKFEQPGGRRKSPVRIWTLVGALTGLSGGFALAIGSAWVNGLVVGGKFTPMAFIPYCIVGFEGTVLLGTIFNLAGMIIHCRLARGKPLPAAYDGRFSHDKFGLFVACEQSQRQRVRELLLSANAEEANVLQ